MEAKQLSSIMCIYHKNCNDGFASALAVKVWADKQEKTVEFIPAVYGDLPPNVEGKDLFIVDFSYPRDVLLDMNARANSIVVLDHHKTAQEALKGLDFCIFNMGKSGAILTWEYLFPNEKAPDLFLFIQDRDLWTWGLDKSREVSAGIKSLDMDFKIWEKYLEPENFPKLAVIGSIILNYEKKKISKIANSNLPIVDILGYKVPCINATDLISDIGNEISKGYPFAAMYFDTDNKRVYGLRSAHDGIDVSEIAKKFGGGGHFHAAGFSVPIPEIKLDELINY